MNLKSITPKRNQKVWLIVNGNVVFRFFHKKHLQGYLLSWMPHDNPSYYDHQPMFESEAAALHFQLVKKSEHIASLMLEQSDLIRRMTLALAQV